MHHISIYREKRSLGHPEAAKLVRRAVRTALRLQGVAEDCVVNVMLTNDAGIREINRAQRGIDSATDVLSFPMSEQAEGAFDPTRCEVDYDVEALLLGDMVLSLERCEVQGIEYGHGFAHELSYLTVHSVLHLLGYDHLDEGPRKKAMRAREKAIMAKLEGTDGVE